MKVFDFISPFATELMTNDRQRKAFIFLFSTTKNSIRFVNEWEMIGLMILIEHLWSIGFSIDANHISNLFDLCQIRLEKKVIRSISLDSFSLLSFLLLFLFHHLLKPRKQNGFQRIGWLGVQCSMFGRSDWITLIQWATANIIRLVLNASKKSRKQNIIHNHLRPMNRWTYLAWSFRWIPFKQRHEWELADKLMKAQFFFSHFCFFLARPF